MTIATHKLVDGARVVLSGAEIEAIEVSRTAIAADEPRRAAQEVLDKHDAEGYTRAWMSAVAPQVAAETLPEYDQTIYDERIAARAVVEG
jgi:hypothetical protein